MKEEHIAVPGYDIPDINTNQAISTHILPETDHKDRRIAAVACNGHRCIISYDHNLDNRQNHAAAAIHLAQRLNWTGTLIAGATREGMVFVWANGTALDV